MTKDKPYPAAIPGPIDPIKEIAEIKPLLQELLQWKNRQEAAKAERLATMRNSIIDMFKDQGANVDEVLSVLGILEHEYREKFISTSKGT